ncbi:hypothetical protein TMatcc_007493 [Talaromyces marneffei ATCC 18224]|uniref:Myb-like domain-containing protein n=1 Tax=Talaromyces marneffei (strain ATCC 18224 / CBS 334.59 / QM 7333) TaxID=441960 RepID=B6QG16_TALMQ|nr:uncharacterized protein EYB26_004451 [Talaromyces marneffei]EEA24401.1 conserved hypothetical protein [Talaromyces marneffei ATCC 18224]KAE8553088.1 hypothetical protein EYB25_004467 [Talaromyces marneffei]QGA16781.1 hypothetical protein EYB26_004451 [Talaromyces marneffei]
MLMQSALSCDTRKFLSQQYYRGLSPTPPPSSDSISGSLLGVSRKLQSLLNVSPGPTPSTPPRSVRLASPFHQEVKANKPKPKTRSRKTTPKANTPRASASRSSTSRATTPAVSRAKTPTAPPRIRKRSRSVYEDGESENEMTGGRRQRDGYTTPKRLRHFPYHMPLGLGIADFESLNDMPKTDSGSEALPQIILPSIEIEDTDTNTNNANTDNDKTDWTTEEDEQLVDMVLEKFRLTKRDWEECARRIGKDDASVGKRWQALLGEGNIGLRRGSGQFVRGRLDGCFQP